MAHIIFDFDGTIANSLPVILKLFYQWSKREPYSQDEIETLRAMPAREVIKAVGVPVWRAPSLVARGRKEFTKHIGEIDVFKGLPEAIDQLNKNGHKLYLMSSNSQHNVQEYLKQNKIDQYFETVVGSAGLFSKARVMKRILKKYHINKSDCISIGDETRDIDAAHKAGITSIAVTWGFNSRSILTEHKPDHIISQPNELLKLIK